MPNERTERDPIKARKARKRQRFNRRRRALAVLEQMLEANRDERDTFNKVLDANRVQAVKVACETLQLLTYGFD
jgi:hypothetical protein